MDEQRAPHLPGKARLNWHILRLALEPGGASWLVTALKGGRVAVIHLPALREQSQEALWLAEIEARCEAEAFDPLLAEYPPGLASCRTHSRSLEALALHRGSGYTRGYGDEWLLVGSGAAAALEKARGER